MSFRYVVAVLLCLVSSVASSAANLPETYPLTKLLIADTEAKVLALPADAGGDARVHVQDVPLFARADFQAAIAPFFGQPISNELLNGLRAAVAKHALENDWLLAKVMIPVQKVDTGTLRFAIILGRYSDFSFQGGNRWFSQKLLRQRLGLKPGDEIRLSTLEEAVNWINTNPYRQVKVMVDETPNQPGKGHLILAVQERPPIRAAFSFDDTGNEIIGKHHYAGLLSYGNLWGWDHQISYNFVTTDDPRVYQGHALDYRIPLESRHFLQFTANYVRTHATFGDAFFSQKGENVSADARYTLPLRTGKEPREIFFGANYKQSNSNLEFGGTEVRPTKTDTFQLYTGFSLLKRDKRGAWLLAATVNASPGDINSRNTNEALGAARSGAHASYIYGSLAAQRLLALSYEWQVWTRATVHVSSHNLIANEQLLIGGANTVRGYDENVFAGEQGFVLDTDLMAPVFRTKVPFLRKTSPPLETRFLAFLDMAKTNYKESFSSDIILAALASTGVGVRSSLGNNLSVSFDYGWQLMHLPRQASQPKGPPLGSRGHIKVVLAF